MKSSANAMTYEDIAMPTPLRKKDKKADIKRVVREERQIGSMSTLNILFYLVYRHRVPLLALWAVTATVLLIVTTAHK